MSFWRRLKNLWILSEYSIPEIGESISNKPTGTKIVQSLYKEPEQKFQVATIIKLRPKDEIEEILKNEN